MHDVRVIVYVLSMTVTWQIGFGPVPIEHYTLVSAQYQLNMTDWFRPSTNWITVQDQRTKDTHPFFSNYTAGWECQKGITNKTNIFYLLLVYPFFFLAFGKRQIQMIDGRLLWLNFRLEVMYLLGEVFDAPALCWLLRLLLGKEELRPLDVALKGSPWDLAPGDAVLGLIKAQTKLLPVIVQLRLGCLCLLGLLLSGEQTLILFRYAVLGVHQI